MFLGQERVECLLYGIGFVNCARRECFWQRPKGMVVSVFFKQEPRRLLKSTFVRHHAHSR